jgi:hypothetical protein
MRSTLLIYIFSVWPLLCNCKPIPKTGQPSLIGEENGNLTITVPPNIITSRAPGGVVTSNEELDEHWGKQVGGAQGTGDYIKPGQNLEYEVNGVWYPLIQLDCTNSYMTGKKRTYDGNYYDICRNYLWLR